MPLFDYSCTCGHRFEKLVASWREGNPACTACGRPSHRLPSRVSLTGGARPPVGEESAPQSWEGTGRGNREYITEWRRKLEHRKKFEDKHPEFASQREAVAAHEGVFEKSPLTYRELAQRAGTSGDATRAATEAGKDRETKQSGE